MFIPDYMRQPAACAIAKSASRSRSRWKRHQTDVRATSPEGPAAEMLAGMARGDEFTCAEYPETVGNSASLL
jgi:hypothetical protein